MYGLNVKKQHTRHAIERSLFIGVQSGETFFALYTRRLPSLLEQYVKTVGTTELSVRCEPCFQFVLLQRHLQNRRVSKEEKKKKRNAY
jgi:hypothetical protein